MNLFDISCYSNLGSYHAHEAQHVGYSGMVKEIISYIRSMAAKANQPIKVLEFGAGTGLLTKELSGLKHVQLHVNEPDIRCRKQLEKKLNMTSVIKSPIQNYHGLTKYDCMVSSFAHDHIEDTSKLALSIRRNLNPSGYYVCGVELLRDYINTNPKKFIC